MCKGQPAASRRGKGVGRQGPGCGGEVVLVHLRWSHSGLPRMPRTDVIAGVV